MCLQIVSLSVWANVYKMFIIPLLILTILCVSDTFHQLLSYFIQSSHNRLKVISRSLYKIKRILINSLDINLPMTFDITSSSLLICCHNKCSKYYIKHWMLIYYCRGVKSLQIEKHPSPNYRPLFSIAFEPQNKFRKSPFYCYNPYLKDISAFWKQKQVNYMGNMTKYKYE